MGGSGVFGFLIFGAGAAGGSTSGCLIEAVPAPRCSLCWGSWIEPRLGQVTSARGEGGNGPDAPQPLMLLLWGSPVPVMLLLAEAPQQDQSPELRPATAALTVLVSPALQTRLSRQERAVCFQQV